MSLSIKSNKSFLPVLIESDSLKDLSYETYKNLYGNGFERLLITSLATFQTAGLIGETIFKGRDLYLRHPLNINPNIARYFLNVWVGYNYDYMNFMNKNNRVKIFYKNFLMGFLVGGYININHLLSKRRIHYRNQSNSGANIQFNITQLRKQLYFSLTSGGFAIGTFWALYFSLCTFLTLGDPHEYALKKLCVSLFSSWAGSLFTSLLHLITYKTEYYYYSDEKIDIKQSLRTLGSYSKVSLFKYFLTQSAYVPSILLNGVNLVTLDCLHLV